MKTRATKLVYFSPTGTTKAILQSIARGIQPNENEWIDLTGPHGREQKIKTTGADLLVVGVPVYMGRVPAVVIDCLRAIEADNTAAVCVVVYGNRAYEDALMELKDILTQCGCKPIAGGAYIGEHSFSGSETPVAAGRPDVNDFEHAALFGRRIKEKIASASSIEEISVINVPGVYPYRGDSTLWDVDFIAVSDECTQCGICAEQCPVGAVDATNARLIDIRKCITCCACIKNCPQSARSMKPGLVRDASVRLHSRYSQRKEPECFW
jgi:ferredoxin